jgi:hypothetical protein
MLWLGPDGGPCPSAEKLAGTPVRSGPYRFLRDARKAISHGAVVARSQENHQKFLPALLAEKSFREAYGLFLLFFVSIFPISFFLLRNQHNRTEQPPQKIVLSSHTHPLFVARVKKASTAVSFGESPHECVGSLWNLKFSAWLVLHPLD